jgi:hypothetical protein
MTIGYRAGYFWRMLTSAKPRYYKGPVGTVKHLLIGDPSPGSGFMRLVKAGKADWTVEALVARDPEKWKRLFTDREIEKAQARLKRYR